jgi:hypothetical protein
MRLNIPHEPTSLALLRFFYVVIATVLLSLVLAYQLKDVTKLGDVYQVEYHSETLPVPVILFRVVTKYTERITPNLTVITQPESIEYVEADIEYVMDYIKWNKNITDSEYPIQNWESINDGLKYKASNVTLQMFMVKPDINVTFTPNIFHSYNRAKSENTPTTEIIISFGSYPKNTTDFSSAPPSNMQVDVFLINNSTLIADGVNVTTPFDLSKVNGRYRFQARAGTKVRLDFLQSYQVTKNDTEESIRDVHFFEERGNSPAVVEFSIIPGNKPSLDGNGYIVKKERARRPVYWVQAAGTIGGAFSLIMFLFTVLFGQSRLRPWGFVQRRLFRNNILRLLPSSMISLKTSYEPGLYQESITDMTYLNQPHPLQRGVTTSWTPKHTDNSNLNTDILHHNVYPNTVSVFNPIQQQYTNTHPHVNEISQLKSIMEAQKTQMETQKTQLEAQMKQFAMMSDRLAALEGDNPTFTDTTAMLDSPIAANNRVPSLSLNQRTKSTIMSSGTTSSVESRLTNLEMFQYRLGTFYLSSDLFDDTTHT